MKGVIPMRLLSGFTAAILTTGCLVVNAQPPMKGAEPSGRTPLIAPFGHPGMHRAESAPPMIMDVEELRTLLTEIRIAPATIDSITGITRKFISQFDRLLIKVQREELGIKEELLKEKPDLKTIQKNITEKSHLFSEIEFSQIKRDLDIKALLTRDEYEKLKSATMKKLRSMMPPGLQKDGRNGSGAESGRKERLHAK